MEVVARNETAFQEPATAGGIDVIVGAGLPDLNGIKKLSTTRGGFPPPPAKYAKINRS
jgi:hypothetical protein